VYGSATWAVAEKDMKSLGTWKRKILRGTYGPVVEQGIWRVRTDQELREIYKDLDIVADIKKKSLECAGRIARMDQARTVKKIYDSKSERCRRRGRPSLGWLEDVQKDLREMGINPYRTNVENRVSS